MVNKTLIHATILLGLLVIFSSSTEAQERRKISRKEVPAPIQQAFRKTFLGVSIKQAEIEEKDGKLIYHLAGKRNGNEVELIYAMEITLIEQQEDIAIAELPAAISASIKAAHPNATVTEAEKITKSGTLIGYEVEIKEGNENLELRITPDGKITERKID
jgi:uncharacterized membrane protein YkoI